MTIGQITFNRYPYEKGDIMSELGNPCDCGRCNKMEETDINMEPLGDRIIVERFEAEEVTAGGIIIPNNYQNPPAEGTVIACGPGKKLDDGSRVPMDVAVGDRVFFAKYAGSEVDIEGKDCLILVEGDIISRMV